MISQENGVTYSIVDPELLRYPNPLRSGEVKVELHIAAVQLSPVNTVGDTHSEHIRNSLIGRATSLVALGANLLVAHTCRHSY